VDCDEWNSYSLCNIPFIGPLRNQRHPGFSHLLIAFQGFGGHLPNLFSTVEVACPHSCILLGWKGKLLLLLLANHACHHPVIPVHWKRQVLLENAIMRIIDNSLVVAWWAWFKGGASATTPSCLDVVTSPSTPRRRCS
jgi:hypothetical protein